MLVYAMMDTILWERRSNSFPTSPRTLEVLSLPIQEEFIQVMVHHGDQEILLLSSLIATTMHRGSTPMVPTSTILFLLLTIKIDADFDDLYYLDFLYNII